MKKKIEVSLCDVCSITENNVKDVLAVRKCVVCEKDLCSSPKHTGDEYSTTKHMRKPITSFICNECWKLSEYFGFKTGTDRLPTGNIDMRVSGSGTAINMAEFREWIESESKRISQDYLIDLLKQVRSGVDAKIEINRLLKEIENKFEAEKTALLSKVGKSIK